VLSDTGLCDRLITRPEASPECGVSECHNEASMMKGLAYKGHCAMERNTVLMCDLALVKGKNCKINVNILINSSV
jgi:hypothetical protein